MIQKRYPKLVIIESTAVIVYLILVFPFWLNYLFSVLDFVGDPIFSFLFGPPFYDFIFLIEPSRLWLISYNLHYLNASKNEKWKSQIDTNIANNDWYIRNKNTFGNQKKVVTAVMIWWFFAVIVVDIAYYIDYTHIGSFTNSFVFLIQLTPMYLVCYQCRKYKQLQDNLLFYYEFTATIIIWTIGFGSYCVAEAIRVLNGGSHTLLVITIYGCVAIFSLSTASLLSTLWIPFKFASSGITLFEFVCS